MIFRKVRFPLWVKKMRLMWFDERTTVFSIDISSSTVGNRVRTRCLDLIHYKVPKVEAGFINNERIDCGNWRCGYTFTRNISEFSEPKIIANFS